MKPSLAFASLLLTLSSMVSLTQAFASSETKRFDQTLKAVKEVGKTKSCLLTKPSGGDRTEVKVSLSCADLERVQATLEKEGPGQTRIIRFRDGLIPGVSIRTRTPLVDAKKAKDGDDSEKSADISVKINCLTQAKLSESEVAFLQSGLKCEANQSYHQSALNSCSFTIIGTELSAEQKSFLSHHVDSMANFGTGTATWKEPITSVAWKLPKAMRKAMSVLDDEGDHPKVSFETWKDASGKCQSFEVSAKVPSTASEAMEKDLVKLLDEQWKIAVNPDGQSNKTGKFVCPAGLE
ncbi:MAG: hypothetical protein H7333_00930 [Bdellovibrionales bacterium]|nr:hypothetical protein [Oligoflexia bacterium]